MSGYFTSDQMASGAYPRDGVEPKKTSGKKTYKPNPKPVSKKKKKKK